MVMMNWHVWNGLGESVKNSDQGLVVEIKLGVYFNAIPAKGTYKQLNLYIVLIHIWL